MNATKRKHDRLRQTGALDYLAGKPIDAFCAVRGIKHLEIERASYEIGWRGEKSDHLKRMTAAGLPAPMDWDAMQAPLRFDGCGINTSSGRRLLTGARADWDRPEFKALCLQAAAGPQLFDTLQALLEFMRTFTCMTREEFATINAPAVDRARVLVAAIIKGAA